MAHPTSGRPVARLLALERRHAGVGLGEIRERLGRGEPGAWPAFVERYSRTIYTLALSLGPRGSEREEVAHAVYLAVLDRLSREDCRLVREFREEARFETYLFTAIRNEVARLRRRRALERERVEAIGVEGAAPGAVHERSPGASFAARIGLDPGRVSKQLEQCLARLDPRERLVLQLRFRDGLSYRRLAALFGWKDTNAAAYEVTRILRKLGLLDQLRRRLAWGEPEREVLRSELSGWLETERLTERRS